MIRQVLFVISNIAIPFDKPALPVIVQLYDRCRLSIGEWKNQDVVDFRRIYWPSTANDMRENIILDAHVILLTHPHSIDHVWESEMCHADRDLPQSEIPLWKSKKDST